MLHFLNYIDFVADIKSGDYSNLNLTKKVLEDTFEDVDSEQPIHRFGVVDDLRILFLSQDFNEVNPLPESLRERNFTLYEKKTIEEYLI